MLIICLRACFVSLKVLLEEVLKGMHYRHDIVT